MASGNVWLEVFSMICITVILFVIYQQSKCGWEFKLWGIPMGVWMAHGFIFYACTSIQREGIVDFGPIFTSWSAVLRLHGYLTVLAIEIFRYYIHKNKEKRVYESK